MSNRYFVEISRYRGSYETRYSFADSKLGLAHAMFYFSGINIGNGYNKRLRDAKTNKVLARVRS